MTLCFFQKFFDIDKSVNDHNMDVEKINQWTYHWKMQFDLGPTKQTNEVILSGESSALSHLP